MIDVLTVGAWAIVGQLGLEPKPTVLLLVLVLLMRALIELRRSHRALADNGACEPRRAPRGPS
jgi:hypothetical protein